MIEVTKQQRANALEALNVMWPSVPGKNVFPRLGDWSRLRDGKRTNCGTVACFGGWCARWPTFKAQGVRMDKFGYPEIQDRFGLSVAAILFGDATLFSPNYGEMEDHAEVSRRLKTLISNSRVID